jgi:hypothetical protein
MRRNWTWALEPRRGIARGVAVFGPPGIERDASLLGGLFEGHERLAGWLSAGQTLSYDANGLAFVETSIDSWVVSQATLGDDSGLVGADDWKSSTWVSR